MSIMTDTHTLKLDWCSHKAAKYAVMKWHYSKSMPFGKIIKVGVWENGKFIGVVLFSRGACPSYGTKFNLTQTQVCELTRVALGKHITAVSKIISIALKMLKKTNNGMRMIVSYADQNQGHVGSIYQAGNWTYLGESSDAGAFWEINGKRIHNRSVGMKYGTGALQWIKENIDPKAHKLIEKLKHKYVYPLDHEMWEQIRPLSKPYPKKNCDAGVISSTSSFQDGGDGAEPIASLYNYV